jgi:hypothetical protein
VLICGIRIAPIDTAFLQLISFYANSLYAVFNCTPYSVVWIILLMIDRKILSTGYLLHASENQTTKYNRESEIKARKKS